MAIRDTGILSRTIFFAVLAALLYVVGYASGAMLVIGLGCVAECAFWFNLFSNKEQQD
tara:strand:+ start:1105 stop:1278 length:174 start_codon:yes stop_codon:yes gene_type:complete